jgi:hypothetical protein
MSRRRPALLFFVVFTLLVCLPHIATAAIFPITFQSFDAILRYHPTPNDPSQDTEPSYDEGWELRYTNSQYNRSATTDYVFGSGQPYALGTINSSSTVSSPPTVNFSFYGTGVEVFGYWGDLGDGSTDTLIGGSGSVELMLTGVNNAPKTAKSTGTTSQGLKDGASPTSLVRLGDLPLDWYAVGFTVNGDSVSLTSVATNMSLGGKYVSIACPNNKLTLAQRPRR